MPANKPAPNRPRYPVRPPAPGPAVILDLPELWRAVEQEMIRRRMTNHHGEPEVKQLADVTGIDRTTLGRTRGRAERGEIVGGQRSGLNVNAYLTLATFAANGESPEYGKVIRPDIRPYH